MLPHYNVIDSLSAITNTFHASDVRLIRDARDAGNHAGAIRRTAGVSAARSYLIEAYVAHYYRANKPPNMRERNSVIVMAEKLLITL